MPRRVAFRLPSPLIKPDVQISASGFPTHPSSSAHDAYYALDRATMVCAGLGFWVDYDGSRPELLPAGARIGDRGDSVHAGGLWRVGIELACPHDAKAVTAPFGFSGALHCHSADTPQRLALAV